MKLGLFGGSFDPVHRGHLVLAESCADQAGLDAVWFVPTANQPLKPQGPSASGTDRLAMLRLALADKPCYVASDIELRRGGVSFTIETLESIRDEQPTAELYFLMGADSLADFPTWHRPADILRLATPLVVRRAGTAEPDFGVLAPLVAEARLDRIQMCQVEMPAVPIASSQIRTLVATGGDWRKMVPPGVADYITRHRLYASE